MCTIVHGARKSTHKVARSMMRWEEMKEALEGGCGRVAARHGRQARRENVGKWQSLSLKKSRAGKVIGQAEPMLLG